MKMNSVAGIVHYVKDINKTAEFYKKLGFTVTDDTPDYFGVRLNWFWLDFHPQDKEDKPQFQKEANLKQKGGGMFVYIKVDNVDQFYKGTLAKGLKPSSEPNDWPWGNREFMLRDPDGYKLVFFHKL